MVELRSNLGLLLLSLGAPGAQSWESTLFWFVERRDCSKGLKESVPKVLSRSASLCLSPLPGKQGAFPRRAGGRGDPCLRLLPAQCFLSPEPPGWSPGSRDQEHPETEVAKRGPEERGCPTSVGRPLDSQGQDPTRSPLVGSCPWLSRIPLPTLLSKYNRAIQRPALKRDSR